MYKHHISILFLQLQLLSEKRNIQLEAENKSIRDDLEQMGNMYNRDIKTRESEKIVLENKITALQNDLDVSNSSLVHVASKMEEVNSKLLLIEADLKKQLHLKDVYVIAKVTIIVVVVTGILHAVETLDLFIEYSQKVTLEIIPFLILCFVYTQQMLQEK